MPRAKFVIDHVITDSFRVNKVKSMFDYDFDSVHKEFDVSAPIEDISWNIGLIVGASGTGKTTIAKRLFDNFDFFAGFEWSDKSIIDDFPSEMSAREVTDALVSVGFSSPPDWLKPFSVLSNGQKMRAELARVMVEAQRPVIYDEFTSVVDRQVACVGSEAIQKFIRKHNKQFVAVSCHSDIEVWLRPDWVIDMNTSEFSRRLLQRPQINLGVRKAKRNEWRLFKDYHYLSAKLNSAAVSYVAEINHEPVAWCSVIHFCHPTVKNMKRIHRIVVRPDYQGVGIGRAFLTDVAAQYSNDGFRVAIVTSSPAFVYGLQKDQQWVMTRKPSALTGGRGGRKTLRDLWSVKRLTATFEFKRAA